MSIRESGRLIGHEPQEWIGGLVLFRKIDSGILASNGADISVLDIQRDRVKLGFKCPPSLRVMRGEIDPSQIKPRTPGAEGLGFLILIRKIGQEVNIGEDMTIRVLSVERNRVKIGIKAPDDVKVMRSELVPPSEVAAFLSSGANHQ